MKTFPVPKVLALVLSIFIFSHTYATTNSAMDLPAMTDVASIIVAAEVVSTKSERMINGSRTLVQLRVIDAIKGDANKTITIAVPGGSYKSGRFRVGETYAGAPLMFANQKALLFLTSSTPEGVYNLVGFSQGYMAIHETDGEKTLQNRATDGKIMLLSTMKDKILKMDESASVEVESK